MFSFIIPCFNQITLLEKTIAGFVIQSAKNIPYEIILIDNNSSEDINKVYTDFLIQYKLPLYLIRQPILKSTYALCKARNLGLKLAHYDTIITLDSDCIIQPDYLRDLALSVEKNPHSIITGERIFIDSTTCTLQDILGNPNYLTTLTPIPSQSNYGLVKDRRLPEILDVSKSQHPWAFFHGGNSIFPKKLALDVGGFDEDYDGTWGYEDIDFAYRLITKTDCSPVFDTNLFCYHQESPNTTNSNNNIRINKAENPNWARICHKIPGFKEFKEDSYRKINKNIIL